MVKIYFYLFILAAVAGIFFTAQAVQAVEDHLKTPAEINQELEQLSNRFEELQARAKEYSSALAKERSKARTLDSQVSLFRSQMSQTQNAIETLAVEIQRLGLERQKINFLIEERELDIKESRTTLETMVQKMFVLSNRRGLEIILQYPEVSTFFLEQNLLRQIQRELQRQLDQIETLKKNLEQERMSIQEKQKTEEEKKAQMAVRREQLQYQKDAAAALLRETKNSESKYRSMVNALKEEQAQIDGDIKRLERALREKLRQEELIRLGQAVFTWPVPNRGITAYFYDPDYPFRYIFEHPAIDIRAAQGSTIAAPANGVVAKVRDAGYGYSYLMLIHSEGFATVYGHVSKFLVSEGDFVTRGQGIALVGGTPGTRGAGPLTTGAHLHFEIRKNGIPVNPLDYLPR